MNDINSSKWSEQQVLTALSNERERARLRTLIKLFVEQGYTYEKATDLAFKTREDCDDIKGLLFDEEA